MALELRRASRYLLIAGSIGLTLLLSWVRVATAARFTFSLLLLVPTMVVAWYLGRGRGLGIAGVAVGAWLGADLLVDPEGAVDSVINAAVRALVFGVVAVAFADLREAHRELRGLALYDPLTGLGNRRLLSAVLAHERQRTLRYRHPWSLACIDLDEFKSVNDRHGHTAGDQILAEVGDWLRSGLRAVDCPTRTGGDEFLVVLPECNAETARAVADRLLTSWRQGAPFRDYGVDVSVGMVTFEGWAPPADAMIAAADAAMYRAKADPATRWHHVVMTHPDPGPTA